jgi:hypothetical protein
LSAAPKPARNPFTQPAPSIPFARTSPRQSLTPLPPMKALLYTCLATVLAGSFASSHAQTPSPTTSAYQIAERGPHHRVLERTSYRTNRLGGLVPTQHRYTELATGMHYLSDGQWVQSDTRIEPCPGGAVARHGQHTVLATIS